MGTLSGWPQSVLPQTNPVVSAPPMTTANFPYPVQNPSYINSTSTLLTSMLVAAQAALTNTVLNPAPGCNLTNSRLGEDVILTDVLAFDIRVFDPTVPLFVASPTAPVNLTVLVPAIRVTRSHSLTRKRRRLRRRRWVTGLLSILVTTTTWQPGRFRRRRQ